MTIQVKYEVVVESLGAIITKSFDTMKEAREYEETLALAEIICSCPVVYTSPDAAERLAAHIIKSMKEANQAQQELPL